MSDRPLQRIAATTEEAHGRLADAAQAGAEVALVSVHSPIADGSGVIALGERVVVVGRDVGGAGVSIDDPRMSRVHFRIAFDHRARSHRVGDAQSRNGTFVDGTRVDSAVLRRGSVIRAGESVFVYDRPDPWKDVRDLVAKLAPTDLSVLLLGETGTGKERTAKALHDASGRSGPFVPVNCAALPSTLLGAELFGHTRGAFSGAVEVRRGLFQAATGGTLFLDEIAEASADVQATLLRALEERTVRPLGSDREISVDTRIVAATHGNIELAVRNGRFRADLHARLAHAIVRLPPLRERRTDLIALVHECAKENGLSDLTLTSDAAEALVRHSWPYNVREIQNLVRSFIAIAGSSSLDTTYLGQRHPELLATFRRSDGGEAEEPQPSGGEGAERLLLESLLAKHRGNVSAVADEMNRPRMHVYRRLRALGLAPRRYRE